MVNNKEKVAAKIKNEILLFTHFHIGKFFWADGDKYEGDFVNGNETGKG